MEFTKEQEDRIDEVARKMDPPPKSQWISKGSGTVWTVPYNFPSGGTPITISGTPITRLYTSKPKPVRNINPFHQKRKDQWNNSQTNRRLKQLSAR